MLRGEKNCKSWNGARGEKFSALLAVAKIGTRRRRNWTSKWSSNQDIQIRQMSQSERMKRLKWWIGQNYTEKKIKKQSNIKRGHTTIPLWHQGYTASNQTTKCSSLPPFSVRVIKDMSELREESQPGLSLPTRDRETFGPNKDMI